MQNSVAVIWHTFSFRCKLGFFFPEAKKEWESKKVAEPLSVSLSESLVLSMCDNLTYEVMTNFAKFQEYNLEWQNWLKDVVKVQFEILKYIFIAKMPTSLQAFAFLSVLLKKLMEDSTRCSSVNLSAFKCLYYELYYVFLTMTTILFFVLSNCIIQLGSDL